MNTAKRTQTLVPFPLAAILAVAILLAGCNSKKDTPISTTSVDLNATSTDLTPSGTETPNTQAVTASPVSTDTPVSQTPTPAATLTRAEEILLEEQYQNPQMAPSVEQCSEILMIYPSCGVPRTVSQITRPEWDTLFPKTEFYLEELDGYGNEYEFTKSSHLLIVEQNGQRYTPITYDLLLKANNIVVTDENRELVARSFALMTLYEYLESDIVFSDWKSGDWPAPLKQRFNYSLSVWTKLQGLRIKFFFQFDPDNVLRMTKGYVEERNVGDYIDVPWEQLLGPSEDVMGQNFWGR